MATPEPVTCLRCPGCNSPDLMVLHVANGLAACVCARCERRFAAKLEPGALAAVEAGQRGTVTFAAAGA